MKLRAKAFLIDKTLKIIFIEGRLVGICGNRLAMVGSSMKGLWGKGFAVSLTLLMAP